MPCITELLRYFPNEKSGFGSFRSQLFDSTNIMVLSTLRNVDCKEKI